VAWQGALEKSFRIFSRHQRKAMAGASGAGEHADAVIAGAPAIAAAGRWACGESPGIVREGDYDVWMREFNAGAPARRVRWPTPPITKRAPPSPTITMARLVSWEGAGRTWGKDFGAMHPWAMVSTGSPDGPGRLEKWRVGWSPPAISLERCPAREGPRQNIINASGAEPGTETRKAGGKRGETGQIAHITSRAS